MSSNNSTNTTDDNSKPLKFNEDTFKDLQNFFNGVANDFNKHINDLIGIKVFATNFSSGKSLSNVISYGSSDRGTNSISMTHRQLIDKLSSCSNGYSDAIDKILNTYKTTDDMNKHMVEEFSSAVTYMNDNLNLDAKNTTTG